MSHALPGNPLDDSSFGRPHGRPLGEVLAAHEPRGEAEAEAMHRVRALTLEAENPWLRTLPLHVTSSAVIVHPPTRRVLLRWHQRQGAWLHVGGHGDPGENVPLQVAVREAVEETALIDLRPWPDDAVVHLAVVPVPASNREPAHEHADLRFVLVTDAPDAATPEDDVAALRWLSLNDARATTTSVDLLETLTRVDALF